MGHICLNSPYIVKETKGGSAMVEAVRLGWGRKKVLTQDEEERLALGDGLSQTRVLLNQAYAAFNQATDRDLIESYVFEISALQSRYAYLLKKCKELDLRR